MKTIVEKMMDPEFVKSLPKSRSEAKQRQLEYYLSKKPCPKNHVSYRRTINGACAQCQSEITMQYLATHAPLDRTNRDQKWNASIKGKSAKQKWKEKDPKWAWVVSAVGGARHRAKNKGIPFELDNEYIYKMLPEVCPALGTPIKFDNKRSNRHDSPSIDRIIPEKGYVRGNVAIISCRANAIKSDANVIEIEQVLNWMKKQYAV